MGRNNVLDYNGFAKEKLKIQPIPKSSLKRISNNISELSELKAKDTFYVYHGKNSRKDIHFISSTRLYDQNNLDFDARSISPKDVENYVKEYRNENTFAFSIYLMEFVKQIEEYTNDEMALAQSLFFNPPDLSFIEDIDEYNRIIQQKRNLRR